MKPYRIYYDKTRAWCLKSSSGMLIAAYLADAGRAMDHLALISKLRAI